MLTKDFSAFKKIFGPGIDVQFVKKNIQIIHIVATDNYNRYKTMQYVMEEVCLCQIFVLVMICVKCYHSFCLLSSTFYAKPNSWKINTFTSAFYTFNLSSNRSLLYLWLQLDILIA